MPLNAFCEAPFPPEGGLFRGGDKVYTEDVGGSSPSSPTIKSSTYADFAKFSRRTLNLSAHFCRSTGGA